MASGFGLIRCGIVALALLSATGCKIVPIDDPDSADQGFNAASYVDELWHNQIVPLYQSNDSAVSDVLAALREGLAIAGQEYGYNSGEGSPWSFIVSGQGEVIEKNTESRAGTLTVELAGVAEPTQISLQIGPVIRGNAVRDSLPFVSFHEFTNQLEYADVGRAITARTFETIEPIAADIEVGDEVRFSGAFNMSSANDAVLITPVVLEVIQ